MKKVAVARLAAVVLAAVVGLAAGAAAAQTKVVVRSDFKFNGYVSPLALAIDKGFYREAGLDVAIEQGQGSATTVQTVASGVDQFGRGLGGRGARHLVAERAGEGGRRL
jgi:NitT/TauT family transport system substrate-binding protein